MSKAIKIFAYVIFAAVVILLVYGYGDARGYQSGFLQGQVVNMVKKNKAEQTRQENQAKKKAEKAKKEMARKKAATQAAEKAVQESSLFKVVETNKINPLVKAKKVLNPFD